MAVVGPKNQNYSLEGKNSRHNFKIVTRLKPGAHVRRLCTENKKCSKRTNRSRSVPCYIQIREPERTRTSKIYIHRTKWPRDGVGNFVSDETATAVFRRGARCGGTRFFFSPRPDFRTNGSKFYTANKNKNLYVRAALEGAEEYTCSMSQLLLRDALRRSVSARANEGASRKVENYRIRSALNFVRDEREENLNGRWYERTFERTRPWLSTMMITLPNTENVSRMILPLLLSMLLPFWIGKTDCIRSPLEERRIFKTHSASFRNHSKGPL